MPSDPIKMRWPMKGLSDNASFAGQPPDTTREATNVRGLDSVTGRERGAQRSGLSKYNTNLLNGSAKVRDLKIVVGDNKAIDYALDTTPTQLWSADIQLINPESSIGDLTLIVT